MIVGDVLKPTIIALTGFKGSGKDTVAKMLFDRYPEAVHLAFADPIRQRLMDGLNLTLDEYDRFKRRTFTSGELSVNGRDILRLLGMTMRSYDEDQFVRYVENSIQECVKNGRSLFIITDLRFDNELQFLYNEKKRGSEVWVVNVTRPDVSSDGHITERGFDHFDLPTVTIQNDGSIQQLESEVKKIDSLIIEQHQDHQH